MTKHTTIKPADGLLSAAVWNELHDFLTLALDALGEKPEDFTPDFLRNSVMHQRSAIRIAHGALERLSTQGGAA